MRRSSRLALPMGKPSDVIPHLGKASHWKQGRSAKSLADIWFRAGDIPRAVRQVLMQSEFLGRAEFLEAWLERETDLLDNRGTPSQTDLLALLGLDEELVVLGVEAKVDESFGQRVSDWLSDESYGKEHRLTQLCYLLGLQPKLVGELRYQLLHRTAAVILEAKRFRSKAAVLVVQSFCPRSTGIDDCMKFFDAVGLAGFGKDRLAGPRKVGGVLLWAGWASDQPLDDPDWEQVLAQSNADIEGG